MFSLLRFRPPPEEIVLRLALWGWGVTLVTIVTTLLLTYLLWDAGIERNRGIPVLQRVSALVLKQQDTYVRLPGEAFQCGGGDEKNSVRCVTEIAGQPLQITLFIHSISGGEGSYSGACRGSYAGSPFRCLQMFGRAADRTQPPILIEDDLGIPDEQWRELAAQHRFAFPNSERWMAWGTVMAAGIAAGLATWLRRHSRQVVYPVGVGAMVFTALVWLALWTAALLEEWIERF